MDRWTACTLSGRLTALRTSERGMIKICEVDVGV